VLFETTSPTDLVVVISRTYEFARVARS